MAAASVTLTAVTVVREAWPRHSCLLSPVDLPDARMVLVESSRSGHKVCGV